ncbi:MAG: helix-turn-helix domain-containing protein [Chlamydiales bacterium]
MHNEFVHLGKIFKRCREEKNLSLKEVESALSIRLNYLQAIEEGQLGKLISPIYAQGFIKKYAAFLDIDGDLLIREHPHVMKILKEQHDKQDFSLKLASVEVRGSPGGELKWLPNLVWVTVSVIAMLAGWFLVRYFGLF